MKMKSEDDTNDIMTKMINTTLCYIEQNGKYLMLNRNKKVNDLNAGKWIGIGGKDLPIWEGDRLFLEKLLAGEKSIEMTLVCEWDKLIRAEEL